MIYYRLQRINNFNLMDCISLMFIIMLTIVLCFVVFQLTGNTVQTRISKIENEMVGVIGGEYLVSFNTTLRLPNYTLHKIIGVKSTCKTTYFKEIRYLGTFKHEDFTGIGYDRGHLASKVDIQSCSSMTMANVVPQIKCFNEHLWKELENYIRNNFYMHDVLTVPEYKDKYIITNHGVKIYIPVGFYKLVMKNDEIVFSIYHEHNEETCKKTFLDGDRKRLPYFIKSKE